MSWVIFTTPSVVNLVSSAACFRLHIHSAARQDGDFGRNFAYFTLIFCLFSAYGTPSAVSPPTCLRNSPISAYFHLFPAYFPPKMEPPSCYKLKHGTHLLFFHLHVYGFCLCSFFTYFPPSFLPIFAGPVLPGGIYI